MTFAKEHPMRREKELWLRRREEKKELSEMDRIWARERDLFMIAIAVLQLIVSLIRPS
jgi:hypothetical protein